MQRFRRLAHSIWHCKYHVVWIPKYRRKQLYGKQREVVVRTIKKWAHIKGVEIIEGHAMRDHVHLCLAIPPKYAVSSVIGLLKGKSAAEVMSFGTRTSRMLSGGDKPRPNQIMLRMASTPSKQAALSSPRARAPDHLNGPIGCRCRCAAWQDRSVPAEILASY